MKYAVLTFVVFVLVIVIIIIRNKKINGDINQNGNEADAVVSRINRRVTTNTDGGDSVSYFYYVTYRTMNGQTQEALLGSGRAFDVAIGKWAWDRDLEEGVQVRIKYLPEKPNYAIRIK